MNDDNLESTATRLVIVDDHDDVRLALVMALGSEDGLKVVGQAASIAEAKPTIRDLEPDVVVLDLSLPDGSGVELCRSLKESMPSTACILHTGTLREFEMEAATEAGAVAVVLKSLSGSDLLDAIHKADPRPPSQCSGR